MLFDGIKLVEGSEINNLIVQTGTTWPEVATEGELFYMKEGGLAPEGLYVYDGANWDLTNNTLYQADIVSALGYTPANKAGDTFSGPVVLSGAPSLPLEAATKSYVDSLVGGAASAAQPLDADLTAIAALNGAGLLRRTAVNNWVLDASAYLIGNQSITFSGDSSGSGTTAVTLTHANTGVTAGSYGLADSTATLIVDSKGRIVSAANTPIAIDTAQVVSGTFNNARVSQGNVTQHQAALSILESQISDGAILARVASPETITGAWQFSTLPTGPYPSSGSQFANKDYVDNIAAGINPQRAVKVATTVNITLSGLQTIDGYAVNAGERVLVKNQSTGSQNGVYLAAAGAWTRSSDFDGSPTNEVNSGALVYVEQGTTNGNSSWVLVSTDPITIGTTALIFSVFSRPGDFVAGAGLTKVGNQFDVVTSSPSRIVVNADSIDLATVGTAGTYTSVTTDAYGRVTAGSNPGFITGNQSITLSGDASGTGTTAIAVSLATVNSSPQANTFSKITVNSKGLVTATSAVNSTDITTALGFTPVNLAGDTMTGNLSISRSSVPTLNLNTTSNSTQSIVTFSYNSLARWRMGKLNNTETGSNSGSDFNIGRYDDAGTFIDAPFTISRATGLTTVSNGLSVTGTVTATTFSGSLSGNAATATTATTAGNVTGTVAIANGGTGATSAENACDNLGAPRINPSTPKDGDIQVAGSVISIYANGAWRQVYPAVYS